jgi:iron complex outermembrane receptor protein
MLKMLAKTKLSSGQASITGPEIIVTAEKRAESIQRVPIAITAIQSDVLAKAGISNATALQEQVPSLQIGKGGNDAHITMRGIGGELPFMGSGPSITMSVDGIPLSTNTLFDVDLMDTERVEVLRGPQRTIAGLNSAGGTINICSKLPGDEFEGGLNFTVGSYSRISTDRYFGGKLTDAVRGRVAFKVDKADGWLHNSYLNQDVASRNSFMVQNSRDFGPLRRGQIIQPQRAGDGARQPLDSRAGHRASITSRDSRLPHRR